MTTETLEALIITRQYSGGDIFEKLPNLLSPKSQEKQHKIDTTELHLTTRSLKKILSDLMSVTMKTFNSSGEENEDCSEFFAEWFKF